MSNRGKRHLSKPGSLNSENRNMVSGGPARKKQKIDTNSSEDERSFWTPKHLGDLKAYNRSASEIPAELFRKDLISAMKLADNEPLKSEDFWGIADQWKQEWERGVQVPVNPDSLPEASVHKHKDYPRPFTKFTLPDKFIRVTHTEHFDCDLHTLSSTPAQADKMCRYDMDNLDDSWLTIYNGERAKMGAAEVPSEIFEVIIENLEETCWKNIHKVLRQEETDSVEHDEDVICDVCQSPNSEEGNEMVFCDMCNICVHQWCYGITAIPSGSWICRTCALGIKPTCVLCPNKGGAMKCTINCQRWAHVSCALWTPEASIGSVQRMEPITRIANIPQSRWSLVCVLCRERWGACIQCSVKTCKTAYHVTCAFKHGLEMKAITEDENEYPVQLRSYCEKHSRSNKKDASDQDSDGGQKKKKDLSKEQSNQAKAAKLRQIEAEFYKHVDVPKISTVLDIDLETTEAIYYYWKLKRRSLFNKPLLTPRVTDDVCKMKDNPLSKAHSATRQHLERVRNLSYMVIKREKLSKGYLKLREEIFLKQTDIIFNQKDSLNSYEKAAIQQANHSSSLYDRMGASSSAPVHSAKQFEKIVSIIQGSLPSGSEMASIDKMPKKIKKESRKDINGIIKTKGSYENANPYRKSYFNGAYERRSRSRSASQTGSSSCPSTGDDSDGSATSTNRKPPDPGKKMSVFTSSDDDQASKSGQGAISKFKALLSSAEDSFTETKPLLPTTPRGRGRGGPVKRGRGRPPSTTKARALKKEKKLFSSDEEKYPSVQESKNFDALMKSTPFLEDVKPTIDEKPIFDSSEDEVVRKPFSPRACKIKPPINHFNASFSSSEDDAPPAKRSPCRGRGRGRSRGKTNQKAPPRNPVQSWLPSTKSSDEDLAPALYKLTSDDDEASDASKTGLQSGDSGAELPKKRKTRKSEDSTSASECEFDAVHRPRTKGAVKEFAPKLEEQMVKMSRKPSGKSKSKKKGGKANLDSSNDSAKESSQSVDLDAAPSLSLVVPQRAAAKKASELITSQNTVPTHASVPVVPAETEVKKPSVKHVRDSGSDSDSLHSLPDDLKRVQKIKKFRRDRNSSEAKEEQPPKKNIFQTPEILPYVPLREAARKAAENLKGTAKISSQEDPEIKQKKHTKADKLPTFQKSSKLHRSPRSSSKSSVAVTSDSEEDARPPLVSRPVNTQPAADKGKSIFSESDDEAPFVPKSSEPTVDPKALLGKQQLFRGDIFVFDHQSSSEDDVASTQETSISPPPKGRKKKKNSFRRSAVSPDDKLEVENTEPPTVARRKAPDKKLKTSDGRPELGLQPPVTKGAQSPAGREDSSASNTPSAQEELRQRGLERRPGALAGHVSKSDHVASSQSPPAPTTIREPSLRTQSPSPKERKRSQSPQKAPSPAYLRPGLQPSKISDLQGSKVPEKGFKSTFQCVTPSQEETPVDVETNSPKALSSARLSTSSDPDRNYKDKSLDSDDDNISVVDSLVEQPKDSGYKSSMTTPEPSETSHESSSSSQNSTAERVTSDEGSLRKGADGRSKYVSPGRRKNLQDVIEERTKMAERSDKRKLEAETVKMPATTQQRSEEEDRDDSQSSSEPTRSNAPSSFVEEWREQWVSSSPPPTSQAPATTDHQEGAAPTYPHVALSHSHAMNAQQQLSDYPSFLDMPGHSFHDNLMYYSRLQMMHLHYMSQLSNAQMDESGERARLQQAAMNMHANQQRLAEDQAHRITHGHSAVPDMSSFPAASKPAGGHSELPSASEPRAVASRSGFASESNDRHAADSNKNDKPHETPVSTPRRETRGSAYAPPASAQSKTLSKASDSGASQNHVSYPTAVTSTHTVTTTNTKLSSGPTVSESPAVPVSDVQFLAAVDKDGHVCSSSALATKSASIPSTTVSTASCTPVNKSTTSHLSSSPICAVKSPSIKDLKSSVYSPEILDVETVDASPPIKRVPIYMQEPKTPRTQTKPSPRNAASSPRWTPKQEKKRAPQKSARGRGRGRGRGAAAKRGRGRRSAIAVPKELVGTVYEFDDFDEMDAAPPTNLRMMREKRQSVETTPQQSFTPTYPDFKQTPPTTKKSKEKKSKSKASKHEEVPSSPIITPSPLRDPLALDEVRPSKSSGGSSERKKTTPSFPRAEFTSTLTSDIPDDCTNQLKLKIKGPYANSCGSSTLPAVVVPETTSIAQVSAAPSSSKIRRMRKKELILQYCYQDQVSEQTEDSNANSNPPHRSGISIPKAVASMPHIPTREDYKKYTLEDSPSRNSSTGRRKKQPRELKQLNWSMKEDKNKRGDRSSPDTSRKRARANSKSDEESTKLRITIGKNSPEVVSCGKPPKKRLPDNMLMKVMSDNLKFREQIMKDFDDGISKAKPVNEEKKTRKKRAADDSPNEGNPNKLVVKLSKSKSTDSDTTGRSTPNAATHPLKIRLNLASLNKNDSGDSASGETSAKNSPRDKEYTQPPLKLKLQRRPEGYVTFNNSSSAQYTTPLNHGPGPPSPKRVRPPDPLAHPGQTEVAPNIHSPKEIEHKDRESLTDEAPVSDAVMEKLEAQLAAADGGFSEELSGIPFSSESNVPCFPIPVPTIKDNPGCR